MSDGGRVQFRFPSVLTFAAFEDTGWYLVNYTNIDGPTFGRGASCGFLLDACIVNGKIPPYADQWFCTYDRPVGCTNEHELMGMCNARNLTDAGYSTPSPLDYFNDTVRNGNNIVLHERDI